MVAKAGKFATIYFNENGPDRALAKLVKMGPGRACAQQV